LHLFYFSAETVITIAPKLLKWSHLLNNRNLTTERQLKKAYALRLYDFITVRYKYQEIISVDSSGDS
jgi:hypothetical protein